MSYKYLNKSEQDEIYDLKVIVNNLTGGLLNIVSIRTFYFDHNDPYGVNWAVNRMHTLRKKNETLEHKFEEDIKLGL